MLRSGFILMVLIFVGGCSCKPPSVIQIPEASPQPSREAPSLSPEKSASSPTGNASSPDPQPKVDSPPRSTESGTEQPNAAAELISFDDLIIGMPVDAKFRPLMLSYNDGRVEELLEKRVNVAGFMNATDSLRGVKEFILLRNTECKFGPGGQADHLVHVLMQGDLETEFTDKIVYVEGTLRLNPFPKDGPSTWSIYDLEATKVSTKPPPRRR